MRKCEKCKQLVFKSYFLYKTHIETPEVCHNEMSALCVKCEEPECDLTGWSKEK